VSQPVTIKDAAFGIDVSHDEERIVVRVWGTADMGAVDRLDAELPAVHAEAQRRGVRRADVDVRQLEFMSSSCFKSFITWLTRLEEMPESARYRIHFISNPAMHWQRRSLHALRSFAVELVTIEG
jgi:hypothetical protein